VPSRNAWSVLRLRPGSFGTYNRCDIIHTAVGGLL
jgi:hypothetical protein